MKVELVVAGADDDVAAFFGEIGDAGIKLDITKVLQGLSQSDKLRKQHGLKEMTATILNENSRVVSLNVGDQEIRRVCAEQAALTSFFEPFSCRDFSCRCWSLLARIQPRSMSDTV